MHTVRLFVAGLFSMLIGSTAWAAACDGFTDVDSAASYCTAVVYLKDHGITLGCTGTAYCPDAFVTRAQMALFLQRMGQADPTNQLGDHTTTIAGGTSNSAISEFDTVSGGSSNSATGGYSTVDGGASNVATQPYDIVAGGHLNTASGGASAVVGGSLNTASGAWAAAIGGSGNSAGGGFSSIIGGLQNVTAGDSTVVLSGFHSQALGSGSIVIGSYGLTTSAATGSFVFSDGTGTAQYGSGHPNEFLVAASGGIRMNTAKDYDTGCNLPAGGGAWACSSSRAIKRDFSSVDAAEILAKVSALPVMRWRYMNEPEDVRHIGTFSQDFRAAFGLGADDKSISTVDADGVALAAIQGLNAKLEADQALIAQQARDLAQQSHELAEIKAQLAGLVAAH